LVTDDYITGTFTFLRALPAYDNSAGITRRSLIGQTWLNYSSRDSHPVVWRSWEFQPSTPRSSALKG